MCAGFVGKVTFPDNGNGKEGGFVYGAGRLFSCGSLVVHAHRSRKIAALQALLDRCKSIRCARHVLRVILLQYQPISEVRVACPRAALYLHVLMLISFSVNTRSRAVEFFS